MIGKTNWVNTSYHHNTRERKNEWQILLISSTVWETGKQGLRGLVLSWAESTVQLPLRARTPQFTSSPCHGRALTRLDENALSRVTNSRAAALLTPGLAARQRFFWESISWHQLWVVQGYQQSKQRTWPSSSADTQSGNTTGKARAGQLTL